MSPLTQNRTNKILTPKLKHEDTLLELLDFVWENRGEYTFIGYDKETVHEILRTHYLLRTLIYSRGKEGKVNGVLLWEIEQWLPMRIYISQLVGKHSIAKLLHKLSKQLPPHYEVYAHRRGKIVHYNGPRVLKHFRNLDKA